MFDITKRESFLSLNKWLLELRNATDLNIVLLANKSDLESHRQVELPSIKSFAAENKLQFFEVSCKTGANVNTALASMMSLLSANDFRNLL